MPDQSLFLWLLLACTVVMTLFAIDDLLIDALRLVLRAFPERVSEERFQAMKALPQKKIAIMVANWKEADVIGAMVEGNLARVDYENYCFFLGVYPNDTETVAAVERAAVRHPGKVFPVVNRREGPTSKGQMLNECVTAILADEATSGEAFDAILMHDSEDAIHPDALTVINASLDEGDFVQLPVFSFALPLRQLVGATYIDEFSEHHTREMLVRARLGAAVPSAGTGTAMSHRLATALMRETGALMKEDTLTEDYHLGNSAHRLGFRTRFVCMYHETAGGRDFVATREFFPKRFQASLRQKTRWAIGIVFQGAGNLPWRGGLIDRYFLWRDRRGFYNAYLIAGSFGLLATSLILPQL